MRLEYHRSAVGYIRPMRLNLFTILISMLLVACSSSHQSVHESRLQKRRHAGGWHLDLHARRADAAPRIRLKELAPRTTPASSLLRIDEREPIACSKVDLAMSETPLPSAEKERAFVEVAAGPACTEQQEEDENLMPRKKWNPVAVPAFVSALGSVALGFGTNLWLLVGAIALTFILCAWSIARIRRKEQAGKGFAMAALIIGVLAALLTLMSIGRYGTEL